MEICKKCKTEYHEARPAEIVEVEDCENCASFEFIECDTCKTKPGMPDLCHGCYNNRTAISILQSEKEIVICAAIRMKDGYIVRGHRHCNALLTASGIPRYKGERPWGENQGFVTSKNRYVDRIEAAKIQKAAGIVSKMPPDGAYLHGECYSEDLY